MDSRIFNIYMCVLVDKANVVSIIYNLDKNIYKLCPSLAKPHNPRGGTLNPLRKFVKKYATNATINNICGTKEILREGAEYKITELNNILKEYNIHLYQDELDALLKKINKKIDRQWDEPTKFYIWKEKILNFGRRVLYNIYAWRIKRKLNSYLEEPIAVKVRKPFKVFG